MEETTDQRQQVVHTTNMGAMEATVTTMDMVKTRDTTTETTTTVIVAGMDKIEVAWLSIHK